MPVARVHASMRVQLCAQLSTPQRSLAVVAPCHQRNPTCSASPRVLALPGTRDTFERRWHASLMPVALPHTRRSHCLRAWATLVANTSHSAGALAEITAILCVHLAACHPGSVR